MNAFRLSPLLVTMLTACLLSAGCDEQKTGGTAPSATTQAVPPATTTATSAAASASASASVAAKPATPALPPADYDFDVAHSKIGFTVKHAMVSTAHGAFKKFTGAVHIDETDLTKTVVNLDIETDSIDTADAKRDTHLKSPEFFDTKKFPKMTFKSKTVERSGDGYKVIGDLTIKDVTKPVTLTLDALSPEVKDPWGGLRRGTHAAGTLNRTDFGLKWNAALEAGGVMVSEEVKLDIDIELTKKKDATAAGSASASASAAATAAPSASAAPKK